MQCQGKFVFKGIEEREGGEFLNDKGQKIKFAPCYQIKVDEMVEGKVEDRTFKFSIDNKYLFNKFKNLEIYDNVSIDFNVEIYKTSVKLVPIEVDSLDIDD